MKIRLNENYARLSESYLFSEIGARVRRYSAEHPKAEIIRLGIGDVTRPLPRAVVDAMKDAAEEQAHGETFRGYAPEYGYGFLREALAARYAALGVNLSPEEIFVSDGAKSDVGNIVDILGDNTVYIPDPVYPVYMDSNLMSGRHVVLLPGNAENGFLPMPDSRCGTGVYYLCSPNNPTGAVYSAEQLEEWVNFCLESGSLIIFDAAYEAFISGGEPHSVYTVPGAERCAVEICSFSKTAGFTGTRCAWCVMPDALRAGDTPLNSLWRRRQATKYNGVPYIVQRGAMASLSEAGMAACRENIAYYMENAGIITALLDRKGIFYTGGISAPYIWMRCPGGMKSWDFFDYLLDRANVVGTPGAGFGNCGEGYFRLTAFGSREATAAAAARMEELL